MRKFTNKEKRRLILTFTICTFIIGISIKTSFSNIIQIREKKMEKVMLTERLEDLKDAEKILSDDVIKLKNPEYAARYAREKYLYSKDGEIILKID